MRDNSKLRLAIFFLPALLLSSGQASAQECHGKIVQIERLNDVRPTYPLYMDVDGRNYTFGGGCIELSRQYHRGAIKFFVRNLFPEAMPFRVGAIYVQSIRSFTGEIQTRKIKVSRGEGWYVASRSQEATSAPVIEDRPIGMSVERWNALHEGDLAPLKFSSESGVDWHSYATEARTIYSADEPGIWRMSEDVNWSQSVATNYLIRFEVNTDRAQESKVPFFVFTPDAVTEVRLKLRSNIGMLYADYRFILRN